MANKLVTVIGGTGFVGQAVVNKLLRRGYDVQVLARNARNCKDMFPFSAGSGRLLLRDADITQPKTMHDAFDGSWAVINLVGIMFEKGRQRFSTIHTQCAERIAKTAKEAGVSRFIHLSALGVNNAKGARYASSKATGEQAVLSAFPDATILSPSVIFGADDNFINMFDKMAQYSPILPLVGGGKTRFQPVYVEDVAEAVLKTAETSSTKGKTYELGGPDIYSLRKVIELILEITERKRILLPISWTIAKIIGFFSEFMPKPILTRDQVTLLKSNNIVSKKNGFAELGIIPKPMRLILPNYLIGRIKPAIPAEETKAAA